MKKFYLAIMAACLMAMSAAAVTKHNEWVKPNLPEPALALEPQGASIIDTQSVARITEDNGAFSEASSDKTVARVPYKDKELLLDSMVNDNTKIFYAYDPNGNCIYEETQRLKDEIFIPYSKSEYRFDEFNRETMRVSYIWEENLNYWKGSQKKEFSYGIPGKGIITEKIEYYWDGIDTGWCPEVKEEFTYTEISNSRYLKTREEVFYKNNEGKWITSDRIDYTYDISKIESTGNAFAISEIEYWNEYWNGFNDESDLHIYRKIERILNDNGTPTLETKYDWSGNLGLEKSRKTEWRYDDKNQCIYKAIYDWSAEEHMWAGKEKQEVEYDKKGYMTQFIGFVWSKDKVNWEKEYKQDYEYNEEGIRTLYVNSKWSSDLNDWVPRYKSETPRIKENGYIYSYTIQADWDTTIGDWIYNYKDLNVLEPVKFKDLLHETYIWSNEINDWKPLYRTEYQYDKNDCISYTYYEWIDELNDWMCTGTSEWAFMSFYNHTEYTMYAGESVVREYQICEFDEEALIATLQWYYGDVYGGDLYFTTKYYYSETISGIIDVKNDVPQIAVRADGLTIRTIGGEIKQVHDMSGRTLFSGNASSVTMHVPGLYIVTTGDAKHKVILR